MHFTNKNHIPIGWYETLLIAGDITKYTLIVQQLVNFSTPVAIVQSSDIMYMSSQVLPCSHSEELRFSHHN